MKSGTLKTEIGDQLQVEIEYEYKEALPMTKTSPAEPAEININYVLANGCNIDYVLKYSVIADIRETVREKVEG